MGLIAPGWPSRIGSPNALTQGVGWSPYEAAIYATPNLVEFWPMDEPVGSAALLGRKGNRHATIVNGGTGVVLGKPTLLTVGGDTCAEFEASSTGYATLSAGDSGAFNWERTQAWSVEFLTVPKLLRSGGAASYGVFRKIGNSSPFRGIGVTLRWNGNGNSRTIIRADAINTSGSNALVVNSVTDIANDIVQHIVVTYDGSSTPAGMKFYINGALDTISTQQNTLSATIQNSVQVGIGGGAAGDVPFDGLLGMLAVYDRALTLAEIGAHYART